MSFSPNDKFIARAVLVDPQGKPRPDLAVQARALEAVDKSPLPALLAGEGKSRDLGQLEILLASEALLKNHAVPALELWLVSTGEPRWLAASICRVVSAHGMVVFDFGVIIVAEGPFAAIQERPLHGLPQPLHAPLRALEIKFAEASKSLSAVKAALEQANGEKAILGQQLAEASKSLSATKAALEQANADRAALSETLAARETALAEALAQIDELDRAGAPATISEVVEEIGDQLRSVRDSLATSAFALGRVSFDLKVVPTERGTRLAFPTRRELKELPRDVVSSLNLDFAAVVSARPATQDPALKIPDLRGDTEVMARRRLAALDLGIEVRQQELPPDDVKRVGRVIKQLPAPGAPAEVGDVVTILLGKATRKI